MKTNLGFLALLASAFIFAADGVFVSFLGDNFGYFTVVTMRYGVGLLMILIIIFRKKITLSIPSNLRQSLGIFTTTALLAFLSFSYAIINAEKVTNVVIIMLGGALITTVLFGTLRLGEKLNTKKLISILIVIIGLAFIFYPFSFDINLIISFISGIFFGLSNAYRKVLGELRFEVILFYQFILSTIISIILIFIFQESFENITFMNSSLAIFYGASTVLSGLFVTYGFNHFDVNIGQVVLTSEVFFAIFLNLLFLAEIPTLLESVGALNIFVGTLVARFADD